MCPVSRLQRTIVHVQCTWHLNCNIDFYHTSGSIHAYCPFQCCIQTYGWNMTTPKSMPKPSEEKWKTYQKTRGPRKMYIDRMHIKWLWSISCELSHFIRLTLEHLQFDRHGQCKSQLRSGMNRGHISFILLWTWDSASVPFDSVWKQ